MRSRKAVPPLTIANMLRSATLAASLVLLAGPLLYETPTFTYDHGAIVRGDSARKEIALVFTGGDYGDGTTAILDTLRRERVPAGLFVTGAFLRRPGQAALLRRALREGHYVGPHSDKHLLYCDWNERSRSLVTEPEFCADLQRNIDDLKKLGALRG